MPSPASGCAASTPAARYRDTATGQVHHGAILLSHGLLPDLATGDYASALVHLTRDDSLRGLT